MKRIVFCFLSFLFCIVTYGQERENIKEELTIITDSELILTKYWVCNEQYGEKEWTTRDNYICLRLYSCEQDSTFKMLSITGKEYIEGDVDVWVGTDGKVHSHVRPSRYADVTSVILLNNDDIQRLRKATVALFSIPMPSLYLDDLEKTFKKLRYERNQKFYEYGRLSMLKYKDVVRFYVFNNVDKNLGYSLQNRYYEIKIDTWLSFFKL